MFGGSNTVGVGAHKSESSARAAGFNAQGGGRDTVRSPPDKSWEPDESRERHRKLSPGLWTFGRVCLDAPNLARGVGAAKPERLRPSGVKTPKLGFFCCSRRSSNPAARFPGVAIWDAGIPCSRGVSASVVFMFDDGLMFD